ncbi:Zinc finger protein CONSTANS-LIKE 14 [Acorus calamus]|uniref:Zinc finger protein CONSTANS-LIKE 14 n=1 Tax=Acorus calamus TaxID=4465 RepID=A0AAV9D0T4_ACOCL|nr:Zinc finger protein CONSTANS-LIKE 14 [Acorus calamus]
MEDEKRRRSSPAASSACDFCLVSKAVIYCRADSARLCLSCDRHVHSANPLSQKHVRSRICDNCRSSPASVACTTDGLLLCRDCDFDSHGTCGSSAVHHRRSTFEGFTGTPSPLDLASAWGLDLGKKSVDRTVRGDWDSLDPIVAVDPLWPSKPDLTVPGDRRAGPIVGQLIELLRDVERPPPGSPRDPDQQLPMEVPFTSLLTNEFPWENCPPVRSAQTWDFNLGRPRDDGETMDYGVKSEGFAFKSYNDLMKETCFTVGGALNDAYDGYGPLVPEEIASSDMQQSQGWGPSHLNNKWQNSDNLMSQCPTTGSNSFHELKPNSCTKHTSLGQSILPQRNEIVKAVTKVDSELLAHNRGNAMLPTRRKEKLADMISTFDTSPGRPGLTRGCE